MSENTHGEDCDCGCDEEAGYYITLTLEDDTELECLVIGFFEANEIDYVALLPVDEDGVEDEESEVFLYRYAEDEDEQPILGQIETDEEYDAVSKAFDAFLDSIEE